MRYYPGAHDFLIEASRKEKRGQCLFLVVEATNQHDVHAVMLHNGRMKLGSVSKDESLTIKRNLINGRGESKGDDVYVCVIDTIESSAEEAFRYNGTLEVRLTHRVNERLARKFSDSILKEKDNG